jgi:hypothetical protein
MFFHATKIVHSFTPKELGMQPRTLERRRQVQKRKVRHHREQYLRHLVVVCDGNRTLLTGKVARNHVFTLQDWGVL